MQIDIDEKSGFCFGVVRAIDIVEKTLSEHKSALSLGDIVHNSLEVRRLEAQGLTTVTHDQITVNTRNLIIRAHGEPPTTYAQALELGVNIIDATCPVVAKLQERVREGWDEMQLVGGQVIILGKKGHAEVVGLTGQIGEDALVVEKIEDLDVVDFSKPIYMLSQTTQSLELFDTIKREILQRTENIGAVSVQDTICRQVSGRNPHLKNFAARYDVIIFVSGRKSSNGRALFEACRSVNQRSYMIESPAELYHQWFIGEDGLPLAWVGICGATSTPRWQMETVAAAIASMV